MDSSVQPASHHKIMDAPIGKLRRDSSGDMGVGNYTLNSRLLPPVVLPKYSLNNVVIDYQK